MNNSNGNLMNEAHEKRQAIKARRNAAIADIVAAESDMADASQRRENALRELQQIESIVIQETEAKIIYLGNRVAQMRAAHTSFGHPRQQTGNPVFSPQQQAGNSVLNPQQQAGQSIFNPINLDTRDFAFTPRGTTRMDESSGIVAGNFKAEKRKRSPTVIGDPPRHFVNNAPVAAGPNAGAIAERHGFKRARNMSVDLSRNAPSSSSHLCPLCNSIVNSLADVGATKCSAFDNLMRRHSLPAGKPIFHNSKSNKIIVSADASASNTTLLTSTAPISGVIPLTTPKSIFKNPADHKGTSNNTPFNDGSNNRGAGFAMLPRAMATNAGVRYPVFSSGPSTNSALNATMTNSITTQPRFLNNMYKSPANSSTVPGRSRINTPTSLAHVLNTAAAASTAAAPDYTVKNIAPTATISNDVPIDAIGPKSTVQDISLTPTTSNNATTNAVVPILVLGNNIPSSTNLNEVTINVTAPISAVDDTTSPATNSTGVMTNAANVMTDNIAATARDNRPQGGLPPPHQFTRYPCIECGTGILCWGPNSTEMTNHVADCKGKCKRCREKGLACEKKGQNGACKPCHYARVDDCVFGLDSRVRSVETGIDLMNSKAVRDLREMWDGFEDEMDWE
ncbi:hypothetical protein EG328_010493 [Venturia inaequalis]|uniref:Uncharacterized protein n=1 Tax=Venturia inaequalis TaxID=5025 RepID=A0A8H3YKV7_VENIN|nr:hypothetical protein EG328_010493 [Venturia inaequalis]